MYGKASNSGKNSDAMVHPGRRKISVPFVHNYQCQANSGKTAMSKMDGSGGETLQVQNHYFMM